MEVRMSRRSTVRVLVRACRCPAPLPEISMMFVWDRFIVWAPLLFGEEAPMILESEESNAEKFIKLNMFLTLETSSFTVLSFWTRSGLKLSNIWRNIG